MGIEIRRARADELERTHFVVAYSFTGDRSAEGHAGLRHTEEMAPPIVLLADGEIVASLRVYPLSMYVSGTPVPLGGVSAVACLPEQRRKGYVGQLLRHALVEMREKGQLLSALYTPHPSLYRRYGWMVAGSALKCTWSPKDIAFHNKAKPEGHAVRVTEDPGLRWTRCIASIAWTAPDTWSAASGGGRKRCSVAITTRSVSSGTLRCGKPGTM